MLDNTESLDLRLAGIDHVAIEVADAAAAEKFYAELLGFTPAGRDRWPVAGGGSSAALALASGQHLILTEAAPRNDPRQSAAHVAYRVGQAVRDRIAASQPVHAYREDRPSEEPHRCYVEDPWGNRIQLVANDAAAPGLDHVAIETNNILSAREFYGSWLGCAIEHRVGWKTLDYLNAKSRGEADMAEAMPGSRYWNERYSKFEKERRMLRPNVQLYFALGNGTSLAIYLATRRYQAPLDSLAGGTPLLGLATDRARLTGLAEFLRRRGLPVAGPTEHGTGLPIAASVAVRDPGGNFLVFCARRD
jgi:catechol 2,3-dioxygenase-like lactoylglutathione lyase family enzyme